MYPSDSLLLSLGDMVVLRRVELGMRTTVALADAMGVSTRVLSDIENGRRRVGDATYAALDLALQWPPGASKAFLKNGQRPDMPRPKPIGPIPMSSDQAGYLRRVANNNVDRLLESAWKEARDSVFDGRVEFGIERIVDALRMAAELMNTVNAVTGDARAARAMSDPSDTPDLAIAADDGDSIAGEQESTNET